MKRIQRVAPHRNGFPVSLMEIGLPTSKLNINKQENINNHHKFFEARTFGRLAILQTLRDLDTSQIQAPRDTHDLYHRLYMPAPVPDLYDALSHIEEAREQGVMRRLGSAHLFRLVPIHDALMDALHDEYDSLNLDKPKSIYV